MVETTRIIFERKKYTKDPKKQELSPKGSYLSSDNAEVNMANDSNQKTQLPGFTRFGNEKFDINEI